MIEGKGLSKESESGQVTLGHQPGKCYRKISAVLRCSARWSAKMRICDNPYLVTVILGLTRGKSNSPHTSMLQHAGIPRFFRAPN